MNVTAFGFAALIGASGMLVAILPATAAAPATTQTPPVCAAGDSVVWESHGKRKVYHVQGDKYYGNTKTGTYACKSVADAAGFHAAHTKGAGMAGTASAAPAMAGASPAPHHHHKHGAMASPSPAPTGT